MARLLFIFGITLAFHLGCEAVTYEILMPIRATGDEIGLIFTSGNDIRGKQFRKTAEAIQAASDLRIYVALTDNYLFGQTSLHPIDKELDGAINALKTAGMKSENFVGVAHGIGGKFLYSKVKDYPLRAIILMGFCLPLKTSAVDYPVPVLTLTAELDGVTRITRAAEEFGKLQTDMRDYLLSLYKAPIFCFKGMNHAQFATGVMPTRVKNNDLKPDVREEEAHQMVGESVDSFLTATFSSEPSKVDVALKELEQAFMDAGDIFQPFLDVKELDVNGNLSQWTVLAQRHIAEEFSDQIQVNNKVGGNTWFLKNSPAIRTVGDVVIVETKTLVHYGLKTDDSSMMTNIPNEINMKLETKDAIRQALAGDDDDDGSASGPQSSLKAAPSKPTCKSLNELAVEIALNKSTPEARNRYKVNGRPIILEDDSETNSDLFWTMFPGERWERKDGLHVKAHAFRTDIRTERKGRGVLYCKVLSPYRAMEWINHGSLQNPPHLG